MWSSPQGDVPHGFPVANARPTPINPSGTGVFFNPRQEKGLFEPVPIVTSHGVADVRRNDVIADKKTISFTTGPDAWWGTMSCQRNAQIEAREIFSSNIPTDVVIDGAIAVSLERKSDVTGILDRAGYVWASVRIQPNASKGRLQ